MKLITRVLLLCTLFIPLLVGAQDLPPEHLGPNTISMPWKTFYSLWNQAKDPEVKRTNTVAYGKALYIGTTTTLDQDYLITFNASFLLHTFEKKDTLIPILTNESHVESLILDGSPSTWADENGLIQVLINEPGEHTVEAQFSVRISTEQWPRRLTLSLIPIPQSELVLHVPDKNIEARLEPGVSLEAIETDTGTQIRGFIAAADSMNLRWLKKSEGLQDKELKISSQAYTYASLEEEGASSEAQFNFRVLQGVTNLFKIQIPVELDILDVMGPTHGAISQWYTEEKDNQRQIHIYSAYQQDDEFRVTIRYEKNAKTSSYTYELPALYPVDIERFESHIAVGSKTHVQIEQKPAEGVQEMDVRFLPDALAQLAHNNALFYYKTAETHPQLSFEVKSHNKVALLKANIDLVEATTVMTSTGKVMTKATYHLKNSQDQFFKLTLPDGADLLSVFLDGREIQPGKDGDHSLLIPIIKSPDRAYPVEIAYLYADEAMGGVGAASITLPATPLSIGELSWTLHTPNDYQVLYFAGNVPNTHAGVRVPFRIAASNPTSAYASVVNQSYQYKETGLKKRFKMDNSGADEGSLLNQVQVQIPVSGIEHRFTTYLITGFNPQISFVYVNEIGHQLLGWTLALAVFGLFFFTLALLFERFHAPKFFARKKVYLSQWAGFVLLMLLTQIIHLNIGWYLFLSIVLAIAAFSLWQNRKIAHRFHIQVTGRWHILTEFFFGCLLFFEILLFLTDMWVALGFFAVVSILFHTLFNRLVPRVRDWMNRSTPPKAIRTPMIVFMVTMLGLSAAINSARAVEVPLPQIENPDKAQVYLTWDVVEQILKKIDSLKQDQELKIGVGYTLGNAKITGNVSSKYAELKIAIPVKILSNRYVEIPLLARQTAITEALLSKQALTLNVGEQNIFFEAMRTGKDSFDLELDIIVPVREKGGVNELNLESPLLSGGSLELIFGDDVKSIQIREAVWQKRDGQTIRASLGKTSQLHCELATFIRQEESAKDHSNRAQKVYSETYTLLSIMEGLADMYSSIRYRILNQQVKEFKIRLPEAIVVHEIVGDDVESWTKQGIEDGYQIYLVKTLYPVTERYDLSLHYEMPIENFAKPILVPNLIVDEVARDIGYLGIEIKTQAEVAIKNLTQARVIDIRELPQIIKSDAAQPIVYALRYLEQPYTIELEVKEQGQMPMDAAIADNIHYTHVISPEGKIVVQAQMMVRNSRKQFATLTLPEGARLMSAFLDGENVKPSIKANQEILIPLKKQSTQAFSVEFVYDATDVKLGILLGTLNLTFPQMDIQASMITSDVYVPEDFQFDEIGGDFSRHQHAGFIPWYQRSMIAPIVGMDNIEGTLDYRYEKAVEAEALPQAPAPATTAPMEQKYVQQQLEKIEVPNLAGTLPLRIEIPKRGKQISMTTFYTPKSVTLTSKFFYSRIELFEIGKVFFFVIFVVLGYILCLLQERSTKNWFLLAGISLLGILVATISWKFILLCYLLGYLSGLIRQWQLRRRQFV